MASQRISFEPPLLNTSSAFSSSLEQLSALYHSPSTGAVTTRTALLEEGFHENIQQHRHVFFSAPISDPLAPSAGGTQDGISAMNTYGYSPYPLSFYLSAIELLVPDPATQRKPFVVSVAGPPAEVAAAVERVSRFGAEKGLRLLVEINLSCPNIAGTAPAGYSPASIQAYINALPDARAIPGLVPVGLKVPPYTYAEQMRDLVRALEARPDAVAFLTATNTLGNCLYYPRGGIPAFPEGLEPFLHGALSGAMIHPLSLGNVFSLRNMLDECLTVKDVVIIGAGGVADHAAFQRMRRVGAVAVGVATALGHGGVEVLDDILRGDAQIAWA